MQGENQGWKEEKQAHRRQHDAGTGFARTAPAKRRPRRTGENEARHVTFHSSRRTLSPSSCTTLTAGQQQRRCHNTDLLRFARMNPNTAYAEAARGAERRTRPLARGACVAWSKERESCEKPRDLRTERSVMPGHEASPGKSSRALWSRFAPPEEFRKSVDQYS